MAREASSLQRQLGSECRSVTIVVKKAAGEGACEAQKLLKAPKVKPEAPATKPKPELKPEVPVAKEPTISRMQDPTIQKMSYTAPQITDHTVQRITDHTVPQMAAKLEEESRAAGSAAKTVDSAGSKVGAELYKGTRNPSLDFAGKSGKGRASLLQHLRDHGKDFGFKTEAEYLDEARKFLEKPLTSTTESFTSKSGWYFRYDRATNEFGIINDRGGISTYYKPDEGYKYWLDQIEQFAP